MPAVADQPGQRVTRHELPRLYAIADLDFAGSLTGFTTLIAHLAEAARLLPSQLAIQVRARQASSTHLATAARLSREAVGDEALLVLNGSDTLALELGYDGVHWPEAAVPDRPPEPDALRFRSAAAHSIEAVFRARRASATAVVYGPVFAPTWKASNPAGLAALRETAAASPLPIYALGGIDPSRVPDCLDAGAHGVAVLSGISGAADPVAASRRYLAAIKQGGRPPSPE